METSSYPRREARKAFLAFASEDAKASNPADEPVEEPESFTVQPSDNDTRSSQSLPSDENQSLRRRGRLEVSQNLFDISKDTMADDDCGIKRDVSWPPVQAPPPSVAAPSLPPDPSHHDEVHTIFITDLPEDFKERELHNLLRWLPGFEASQVNYKGGKPMGFALFSNEKFAMPRIPFRKYSSSDANTVAPSIYVPVQAGCFDDKSAADVVHDGTRESTTKGCCNDKSGEVARIGRIEFNNWWKEAVHRKSGMEVVSRDNHCEVEGVVDEDKLHVLSKCLVGWCKNFIKIGNLASQMQAKCLFGFSLMRVGGNVILMVFEDSASLRSVKNDKSETLAKWFSRVEVWSESLVVECRRVWCHKAIFIYIAIEERTIKHLHHLGDGAPPDSIFCDRPQNWVQKLPKAKTDVMEDVVNVKKAFVCNPKQDLHGLGYDPFKHTPEFRENKRLDLWNDKQHGYRRAMSIKDSLFGSKFNSTPAGKAAPGFGIGALEEYDVEDEDVYASGYDFEETYMEEVEEPSSLSIDNKQPSRLSIESKQKVVARDEGVLPGFKIASVSVCQLERSGFRLERSIRFPLLFKSVPVQFYFFFMVNPDPSASEITSQISPYQFDFQISDSSLSPITSYKLNGNNYLPWSQSVWLYITGRRKIAYLSDSMSIPEETDPKYNTWQSENTMIMSWLINSMIPEVGENFMLYQTATEIWNAARDTYSSADNTSELFGIENHIKDLRQGDLTVAQYFGILNKYWQQIDLYEKNEWKCQEDSNFYNRQTNQRRVFQFLSGLNGEFDGARGRILATKPLPLVREVFSEIRREESRRSLMVPPVQRTDASALVTSSTSRNQQRKNRPWCEHCKKPDHMIDQCWKLHGKPVDRQLTGSRFQKEAHIASQDDSSSSFSKKQIEELQQILSSMIAKPTNVAYTATEGNVDLLEEYSESSLPASIKIADGSLTTVKGSGSVTLNKNLLLHNVLYAQDSKRVIGSARLGKGLYTVGGQASQNHALSSALRKPVLSSDLNTNKIMLWHSRLDYSKTTWVFLMREKSEVESLFKSFYQKVETQFDSKIKILRSDNGSEYLNKTLGYFFKEKGIVHLTSCVNTPQQNGVAERKNRNLLEVTRSLMFAAYAPKYLWGEALLTATYLINRMPTFVHIHNRGKLDPRSIKCVFLGYSSSQKGYKCYSPSTKKTYVSFDVTFFENQPYFSGTEIQGESYKEFQPVQTDITLQPILSLPITVSPKPASTVPIPSEDNGNNLNNSDELPSSLSQHSSPCKTPSITTKNAPNNDPETITPQPKQLSVYSRRRKDVAEEISQPSICQEPDSDPVAAGTEGNDGSQDATTVDLDDFPIAIRKGVRKCTAHPINKYVAYGKLQSNFRAFTASINSVKIPRNVTEAFQSPEWKHAVEEEIKALQKNKTWSLTDLPEGKRAVGCRWIFTVKYHSDGSVERYKARLVAKGFSQSYGIDYQETFAPVAKLNTIRILLSVAVNMDWKLHQLDIKNAFLNGNLEEEVYIEVPPGLEGNVTKKTMCKLNKSLYGLKQSPMAWFDRFAKAMTQNGFKQSQADHTLFRKITLSGKITLLIVYVDDMIITGSDIEEIEKLKMNLAKEFETKDLGSMRYFLGMEVARSEEGLVINQRKYVLDLLAETGMLDCKPVETPMESGLKFCKERTGNPVNKETYQRLVGKLIYLSLTRPDIAYSVSIVSQHMSDPREEHLEAVNRILRFLKFTPGVGLIFRKNQDRTVKVYTDASWGGELTDRRSVNGYCTYVWGNLVTWRSKKQVVVSRSSAESEFRAMALGICEGMWIKRLLTELDLDDKKNFEIFSDSQSAMKLLIPVCKLLFRFDPPVIPKDFVPHHKFPGPLETLKKLDVPSPPEVPSPDDSNLKLLIEGVAKLVARCGKLFEDLSRKKNQSNPLFSFLSGGNGHDYYERRLWEEHQKLGDQAKLLLDGKLSPSMQKMTAESRGKLLGEKPLERSSRETTSSSVASGEFQFQFNLFDTFQKSNSFSKLPEVAKPFKDDPAKQERFEQFLKEKYEGGLRSAGLTVASNMSEAARAREKLDFEAAAEAIDKGKRGKESMVSAQPLDFLASGMQFTSGGLEEVKDVHAEDLATKKMYPKRKEFQWRPSPVLCKRFDLIDPFMGKPPPAPRMRSKIDSLLFIPDFVKGAKPEEDTTTNRDVPAAQTGAQMTIEDVAENVERPIDLYKLDHWIQLMSLLDNISLSDSVDDFLKWSGNGDGLFSVKACRTTLSLKSGGSFNWCKDVWSGLAPPRVETFLWQISHQKLAVRSELKRRGVVLESVLCPLCLKQEETVQHLFISCLVAGNLWNNYFKLWDISSVLPKDPPALLSSWSELREKSLIWNFIPGVVLWSIWKSRNSVVFEKMKVDCSSLFFISRFKLAKWFIAKFPNVNILVDSLIGDPTILDKLPRPNVKRKTVQSWFSPPTYFFKFNVDGAVSSDGRVGGIGGILKDSSCNVLGFFSISVGPCLPPLAELKAIEKGIDYFLASAWDKVGRLIVESDCKVAVDWIMWPASAPPFFSSLVGKIVSIILERGFIVWYISRSCNWEADSLAKQGIG
ncbi:G patch domain-containing protein TGH [Hibiscus syriacus]|uniref:G patch domain-containing protein TGH n=1 Tax=Hibiscus syriacus TaxID=106335 RepID=A0A6A2Y7I7_HIBSY|nr:G patch domain-containing protein TGH [Hibiscus syriacus]